MDPIRKYNKNARTTTETIHPTVTRLGDFIYLSFRGTKDTHSYEIPLAEWNRLILSTRLSNRPTIQRQSA